MFKVNGLTVEVDPLTLVTDLKTDLALKGINLLGSIKPVNDNIMVSCPSHKGGQEHKPSCGISTKTVHKNGRTYEAGTVHCFTCGYTATLTEFISFCNGIQDGGLYGNNWLKQNYRTTLTESARKFDLTFGKQQKAEEYPTVPDSILDSYAYTHPYMYQRGLNDDTIMKFDIGYDPKNDAITIPVKDLKGQVKWIQTRNIRYKMYNIPSGIRKTDFLFGAYEAIASGTKEVWIVESAFNAMTLWQLGIAAVGLFGTGGGRQYELLKKLPNRSYIIALDNDDAGREGTRKLIQKLNKTKLVKTLQYKSSIDTRDINDLGPEVLELQVNSTYF